jgi:7,8-dihydropterin-6-yl-methyl-4-(beta-D-ribofuranosyl)aminobenzene 5'-phosphate synthase
MSRVAVTSRNTSMPLKFFLAAVLLGCSLSGVASPPTRLTVLVDAFGDRADLRKDWGYSVLIEHAGTKVLFDTGNDAEIFRHNIDMLGVDLAAIDHVVISHRHGDHTDGLRHLLEVNPDVPIHVPDDEYFGGPTPRVFFALKDETLPTRMRYFDGSVPDPLPHGTPWKSARFNRITGSQEIAPGIRVVGNLATSGRFTETPELSLVIETASGQVLVVGCSHPGIDAILASVQARDRPVRLLMGGLHWLTTPTPEVERLASSLAGEWRIGEVAPGHCTGEVGFGALGRAFGERQRYAGLGTVLTVE